MSIQTVYTFLGTLQLQASYAAGWMFYEVLVEVFPQKYDVSPTSKHKY
jgi:hypothetical protein